MTSPAENQQTVETALRKMAEALKDAGCFGYTSSMVDDDACGYCAGCIAVGILEYDEPSLAALRDLVAQAGELRRTMEWYGERRNYMPPAGSHGDGLVERWIEEHDGFDGKGPGARARSTLARLDVLAAGEGEA